MKKITVLLSVLALTVFVNAQAQTSAPATDPQQDITKVIEFTDLDHNFGKIPQGKPVEYDVILKNVSGDSVKIENVQVGCGCTTPKWKPGPYAAGETFKVTLGYNAMSDGVFNKNATIFFNNGLKQVVRFHGETFKAPENAAPANAAVQKLNPKS